jgi:uncharacterized membrane protein YcfT
MKRFAWDVLYWAVIPSTLAFWVAAASAEQFNIQSKGWIVLPMIVMCIQLGKLCIERLVVPTTPRRR